MNRKEKQLQMHIIHRKVEHFKRKSSSNSHEVRALFDVHLMKNYNYLINCGPPMPVHDDVLPLTRSVNCFSIGFGKFYTIQWMVRPREDGKLIHSNEHNFIIKFNKIIYGL